MNKEIIPLVYSTKGPVLFSGRGNNRSVVSFLVESPIGNKWPTFIELSLPDKKLIGESEPLSLKRDDLFYSEYGYLVYPINSDELINNYILYEMIRQSKKLSLDEPVSIQPRETNEIYTNAFELYRDYIDCFSFKNSTSEYKKIKFIERYLGNVGFSDKRIHKLIRDKTGLNKNLINKILQLRPLDYKNKEIHGGDGLDLKFKE